MWMNNWGIFTFPSITEAEFHEDFDRILERVDCGEGPFQILCENGSNLLLFSWDEYWSHFGCIYPSGEKERIEEACRRGYDNEY